MLKKLSAAAIAFSLLAGPVLAQGAMTAPATSNEAAANVAVPAPKAKVAVHKSRQQAAVKHVAKKNLAKKSLAKKKLAKEKIVKKHLTKKKVAKKHLVKKHSAKTYTSKRQATNHTKTVKRIKHQAKVKAAI